jgi:hypothetical protein
MDSNLSPHSMRRRRRPPLLTNIHAIFNQKSIIYTTTHMPLPVQSLPKGIYTIATLDGSCVDTNTDKLLSMEGAICVICSSEIEWLDIITVIKKGDLVCYTCLMEATKTFLYDRLMLLKEFIGIVELRNHIGSSLRCVLPKEKFTLSMGDVFTTYLDIQTRCSYATHIELLYNDLTRLQMKLPYAMYESIHQVSFRWRHSTDIHWGIWISLLKDSGNYMVYTMGERAVDLLSMMPSCNNSHFSNVNDALICVKFLINV